MGCVSLRLSNFCCNWELTGLPLAHNMTPDSASTILSAAITSRLSVLEAMVDSANSLVCENKDMTIPTLSATATSSEATINISAYKFVTLHDVEVLRLQLLNACQKNELKGTVLLALEGLNVFLAGSKAQIEAFLTVLRADERFSDLTVKYSVSQSAPFRKLRVRIKREIITMRRPLIQPERCRAPAVTPERLQVWLNQGQDDEGRPVVMMDTRNAFEVDAGTFHHCIDYRISKFSEFPEIIEKKADEFQGKTVVTFCTGGIRCEKAAIVMQQAGFERVYQLDGGILNYFEKVGGDHWNGSCFVFDEREGLNANLQPLRPGN